MNNNLGKRVLKVFNTISAKKIENIDLDDENVVKKLALDSIQFVELFAALELEFNVELPLDMMNVRSSKEFITKLFDELEKKAV